MFYFLFERLSERNVFASLDGKSSLTIDAYPLDHFRSMILVQNETSVMVLKQLQYPLDLCLALAVVQYYDPIFYSLDPIV